MAQRACNDDRHDVPASPTAVQRSDAARRQLVEALCGCAQRYRHATTVDLALLEMLLERDEPEVAVRAVEEQRSALRSFARDLQAAVADASLGGSRLRRDAGDDVGVKLADVVPIRPGIHVPGPFRTGAASPTA